MAVRHGYGKIAGTDALVFAYDTGDTRNSYRGEPTVNGITYPDFSTGVSPYPTHTVTVQNSTESFTGKVLKIELTGINTSNRAQFTEEASFNTPQTATMSIYAKGEGNTIGKYLQTYSGAAWYRGIGPLTSEYKRYSVTITTGGGSGGPGNIGLQSGVSGDIFYVHSPQLEAKSHATPFINGTRSATQGLLDLAGNSTINLSNVSFDSNAQKTFDGTDDYVSIVSTNTITDYSQPFTMETIFRVDTGATWDNGYRSNIFSIAGAYAGMYGLFKYNQNDVGIQLRDANSTTYAVATNLSKGVYYHLVGTSDGLGTVSLYLNGVLTQDNVGTLTGAPDTQNLFIGGSRAFGGAYGNHYQGDIPIAKYYTRSLTPSEVQSNYRHYKKRFNI